MHYAVHQTVAFNGTFWYTKAAAQRCSIKKVFLRVLQNSQLTTALSDSLFNKVAGLRPWRRCFPETGKIFQKHIFKGHLRTIASETY